MFHKNDDHFQAEIFNSSDSMNVKLQEKLKKSWASIFYEHVFCKIDEELFAVLYSRDNGRPNFPVNILLSLDKTKCQPNEAGTLF